MSEEKGSKLENIRETASDAVEILKQLGTPGVQESLDKAREIAIIAKEIMETLKTPEWQRNLENISLLSQNMNNASTRLGDTMKEFKETGIIEDAQQLMRTAKAKMDSFDREGGISGRDFKDLGSSVDEMLKSIKAFIDELRVTIVETRSSRTLSNIEDTAKEVSDAYRTVKRSSSEFER